jgi:hypothetical protein
MLVLSVVLMTGTGTVPCAQDKKLAHPGDVNVFENYHQQA